MHDSSQSCWIAEYDLIGLQFIQKHLRVYKEAAVSKYTLTTLITYKNNADKWMGTFREAERMTLFYASRTNNNKQLTSLSRSIE